VAIISDLIKDYCELRKKGESMKEKHAKQIADLLNRRNQLVIEYKASQVLDAEDDYEYLLDNDDNVVAAVKIKKMQWYQWELCHLTVNEEHEGKGYGPKLIKRAEQNTKKGGALIIQCTIREDNIRSKCLFLKEGFKYCSTFFYPISKNNVGIWQKVINQG
jgi:N-acetylglutamate synthase-like GNAT family acetyltransferase